MPCARVKLVPLSVSSRPLEANTGIGLSFSLFETIRPLCTANSEAFSMPSRGGGTSLDQAMLTKTLRPSAIGTGLCWVDVTSRWSTLDFTQKPGEGEMLMVTFEAMMIDDVLCWGFLVGPGPPTAAVFICSPLHHGRAIRIPLSLQA